MNPEAAYRNWAQLIADKTKSDSMERWGGTFNFTVPDAARVEIRDDGIVVCELALEMPADIARSIIRRMAPRVRMEFIR